MSLRFKFVLAITGLILVLGLAGTAHARFTLSNVSERNLEKRGEAIANNLQGHADELLLTDDIFALHKRISNVMNSDDDLRYVLILDANGEVKASSFAQGIPVGLREANAVDAGEEFTTEVLDTSEGSILDVGRPVLGGKAGVVRIGLSREGMERQVTALTFTLLALTGGMLIVGVVVAYGLATLLTGPLSRLADAARAVGRGQLSHTVPAETSDEVGDLASAFNSMTQQLREKERDRSRLLEQVISAQEEERKRVARELHDEAGQALTSLLLGLKHLHEQCADGAVRASAEALRSVAAKTLERMHDLALDLRPSALDDLGLVPTLERYVHDYGRKHELNVDFHAGVFREQRLPVESEIAVYRIVQEALTNSAKHALAQHVSVTVEIRNGAAVVVVEDDGRGFDAASLARRRDGGRSLGVIGMQERAALIGGHLTIESRPGEGTAVYLEVPVK